jgi:hypothetical protein
MLVLGRRQRRQLLAMAWGFRKRKKIGPGPAPEPQQALGRAQRREKGGSSQREHEGSQVGLALMEGPVLAEVVLTAQAE